jgi:glycosyltransferase involved in cell wall biosynthesis
MTAPRRLLSALVCTFNRAELLRGTLESLCGQTLPRDLFEVVVVDDGSRDRTRDVIAEFSSRLPLVSSFQRNAGLASARNHALYLSSGEISLLVDDDDLAEPGLLQRHLEAHRRHPAPHVAVLGHTRLAPVLAGDPLMHFVTEVGGFLFSYPTVQQGVELDFSHFWGGRSSCKRAFLMEHGVFNPVFRFGCEDIELAFRLSRQGFKVVYEPSAISVMVRGIDFDGFCRRLFRQGQSNQVFSRLHPDAVVQAWTEVDGALERWRKLEPRYPSLLRSGHHLDRLARLRAEAGLAPEALDLHLLHAAYWTAFRASKLKGIAEKAMELQTRGS